jgi:ParB family transcriptional regulator, chromosome partitioning protein
MAKKNGPSSFTGTLGVLLDQENATIKDGEPAPWDTPMQAAQPTASTGIPPKNHTVPVSGRAKVDPAICRPWDFADRPENDLGDVTELADSMAKDGQLHPVIARLLKDPKAPELKLEIIVGKRRWLAAKHAGIELEVDIRKLDDESAYRAMVGENSFRTDLSDYAKAKSYAKALERGLYKNAAEMAEKLRISTAVLGAFLGFAKLDPAVIAKVAHLEKMSARTGYELQRACAAGYLAQVLRDLPKVESGEITQKQIATVWNNQPEPLTTVEVAVPKTPEEGDGPAKGVASVSIQGKGGETLFVVKDTVRGPQLKIPAPVAKRFGPTFWDELGDFIQSKLG